MNRPLFRLFGIPVTIEPWFLITMLLFFEISGGGQRGLYVAVAIGVFTLVHELGHAVTARRFGAHSEIRLSFLVGWASYAAATPLRRWQRNLISLAGPGAQLGVAVAALAVARAAGGGFSLQWAIIWAGIVLAVFNLMPLWPLDGGHVLASVLGTAGRRRFLWWTVAASAVILVTSLAGGDSSSLGRWTDEQLAVGLFGALPESVLRLVIATPAILLTSGVFVPLFCGMNAYQALQAGEGEQRWNVTAAPPTTGPSLQVAQAVTNAERQGWATGQVGSFPRGWGPSPWLMAELARRGGATPAEVNVTLAGLDRDRPRWMIDRLDRPEIGVLLGYVPPAAATSPAVARARVYHGDAQGLVDAAMAAFHGDPGAEGFYLVAEGLAHRGEADTALQWLSNAVERAPRPRRVATSPSFRPFHGRHEFQQILGVAERSANPRLTGRG